MILRGLKGRLFTYSITDGAGQGVGTEPEAGASNTDELPEGSTNLYYTEARVDANTTVASKLSKAGDSMDSAANLAFSGGGEPTGLPGVPGGPTAGASQAYVDNLNINGARTKTNVFVITTGNITLSGEQTIDGELTAANRVLALLQTDPKENGIYVSAAGAWNRSTDLDNSPAGEIYNNVNTVATNGTVNALKAFRITSVGTGADGLHTLGVDDIEWDFSASNYSEGNGINILGNVISADINTSNLKITGEQIDTIQDIDTMAGPSFAQMTIDNLRLDDNTLRSQNANGPVKIIPNGVGGITNLDTVPNEMSVLLSNGALGSETADQTQLTGANEPTQSFYRQSFTPAVTGAISKIIMFGRDFGLGRTLTLNLREGARDDFGPIIATVSGVDVPDPTSQIDFIIPNQVILEAERIYTMEFLPNVGSINFVDAVGDPYSRGEGNAGQDLKFQTFMKAISFTALAIRNDQNRVGVGTITPEETFHVSGTFKAGNLKTADNTLSATDPDGDIIVKPNGIGGFGNTPDLTGLSVKLAPYLPATLDQQNLVSDSSVATTDAWQSFTPDLDGFLDSVDIGIASGSGTYDVQIRLGEGAGGSILATENVVLSTGTVHVVYSSKPILIAGDKYTIRIVKTAGVTISWSIQESNVYSGGIWTGNASRDGVFAAYMTPEHFLAQDRTNGFTGFGVASPTEAVDVNGNLKASGSALLVGIKTGATQGAAGAVADEVWKTASHATLPDNVLLIGV